jgi:hypothetical protein
MRETMTTFDHIPAYLKVIAERNGYVFEHRPVVYKRGWPTPSAKPFALFFSDGGFIASFASLDDLERALRARAGL